MNQESSSNPTPPRLTLKLKTGVKITPREIKSPPESQPQSKVNNKPGAAWSDEYKQRMQEHMDALAR
jgi:hypothetical protein